MIRPTIIRPTIVCGAVALMTVLTAPGEDFPLKFETIPEKDVMTFPGGSGTYGQLRPAKPAKVKNEPKAVSRHPLYGECRDQTSGPAFVFRLDESKGDGKGYDQLIVDMNQNGDLTDDPVVQPVVLSTERKALSGPEQALFGPIQAPADKTIVGGRPVYFAQTFIYSRRLFGSGLVPQYAFIGQLRFKAGWYLAATVELAGIKEKVGVFDGDSNLRLGDPWQPQTYRSAKEENWTFRPGDSLLVDANASGTFEADVLQSESSPFGPILYLGASPYQITLAPDCASLRVEPWKEELAEVVLQPNGDQVHSVTLAWETPNGKWQLIRPGVADGKVKVPPGNYRLYGAILLGKGPSGDQTMVSGYQRIPQRPVSFAAGKTNTLSCGAPLNIKVMAEKKRTPKPLDLKLDSDYLLIINARFFGANGEVYSTYLKGEKLKDEPSRPSFTIVDDGKQVANGSLEYG